MGSENFSLPILRRVAGGLGNAPARLVSVVTQPDRPAGRGRKVTFNPVKQYASDCGVPVLQPERLRDDSSVAAVLDANPDLIVVASYGQIVPRPLLERPAHRCLNLHPSLLPRYRGASPVAGPILAGDSETGTTLMLMVPKMDAGPIIAQERLQIEPAETAGELEVRLAEQSSELLARYLEPWMSGAIEPVEQRDEEATYTARIAKSDGDIDWEQPAEFLARLVRAYNPWPIGHTYLDGRMLRILRAHPVAGVGQPGVVTTRGPEPLVVATGHGLLALDVVQVAGGKPLPSSEFVRGHRALEGAVLGRAD